MIPKKIHYCWFGRNPLPDSAIKCIESWKKFFPDYEIIEWNEDNFDVNSIPYIQQAYEAKKYAFVSDYARFKILYEHGGLYFDTDVEVIKQMDDIIKQGPFMGYEIDPSPKNIYGAVAPGLGLGAERNMPIYKDILKAYENFRFINDDGTQNQKTVVSYITEILQTHGLTPIQGIKEIAGVTIYPMEYFNPLESLTGKLKKTHNTRSIHWYMNSWSDRAAWKTRLTQFLHRIISPEISSKIKKFIIKAN